MNVHTGESIFVFIGYDTCCLLFLKHLSNEKLCAAYGDELNY